MFDVAETLTPEEAAFVERLAGAIERAGKASAVSQQSGVPEKTVYNWSSGKNASKIGDLIRIAKACGVSLQSLVSPELADNNNREEPYQADIVQIPILDVSAGAGVGIENGDAEIVAHLPFPVGFLKKLRIRPDAVRAVRARGDSMEPTVGDEMLVLINTAVADLHDGEIYALRAPDGLRLKRIQRQIDGSVTLISDNRDKYLPETLSSEEAMSIEVAGHAFWTERLL